MSEYEAAWKDGEEGNLPPSNDVMTTAQAEADRQAQEFSDAFNKDDYAPAVAKEDEAPVAAVAKAAEVPPVKAEPVSTEPEAVDDEAKAA